MKQDDLIKILRAPSDDFLASLWGILPSSIEIDLQDNESMKDFLNGIIERLEAN